MIEFKAESYLNGLSKFGIKLGLGRMIKFLEILGNPHEKLRYIHVAGTNGKGSTALMISNILQKAGYSVGLYTSPHIVSYRERISVNGEKIPEDVFNSLVYDLALNAEEFTEEECPTEFEMLTAAAFDYFNSRCVDIAVMEVGMGGRFDATNVITSPEVCVITNISYDHMEYLGKTLVQISREKAGIIKEGSVVVTSESDPEVYRVFEQVCSEKRAELIEVKDVLTVYKGTVEKMDNCLVQKCSLKGGDLLLGDLSLRMLGSGQVVNAGMAAAAALVLRKKGFEIIEKNFREGLESSFYPARIEVLNIDPLVIVDASHNSAGIINLKDVLKSLQYNSLTLITGMLDDKDREQAADIWAQVPHNVVVTRPDNERNRNWEQLVRFFCRYVNNVQLIKSIEEAVDYGWYLLDKNDCLCVSGSFYLVRSAKRRIKALL